jgi:D-beta-D-heptose 7-phosphate kinase/D-beta-D-heptose 1-phosphate adenosyltransferase
VTPARLKEIFAHFDRKRVVVVGDVYLDEVTRGLMTGVSLESPVPVVEIAERRYNPGAAGNAACNVASLGAHTTIVGVVGADANAGILRTELARFGVDAGGLVVDPARPTNTYGKLSAHAAHSVSQEILRTDTPTPPPVSGDIERQVIRAIEAAVEKADAIVVVDQVGSVASEGVLACVAEIGRRNRLLTVGDSRGRIHRFKGFNVAVPNDGELGLAFEADVSTPEGLAKAGRQLLAVCDAGLITCGERGITGFGKAGSFTRPAMAPRVVDVTGAGDTVTAAVTLSLLAGASLEDAAYIGNAAAAVAVGRPGVVTVRRDEVIQLVERGSPSAKVVPLADLRAVLDGLRRAGKRIVWTNGCFDIIHAGHVLYLERAAQEGDVLVVGLNSDASVRALKGPSRPIVPEDERALILSAFAAVGFVTVFDEASPLTAIEVLRPDVYVKGGDYTLETINQDERRLVEGYGGRIAIIPGVEGRSTTHIVRRLSEEYPE